MFYPTITRGLGGLAVAGILYTFMEWPLRLQDARSGPILKRAGIPDKARFLVFF